jgi:hypothetical protein
MMMIPVLILSFGFLPSSGGAVGHDTLYREPPAA